MISLKPPASPSLAEFDLDAPALRRGIALIHAEQIAGEKCRLVAAGAGADFEDGVALVSSILGQEQDLDILLQVPRYAPRSRAARLRPVRAYPRRSPCRRASAVRSACSRSAARNWRILATISCSSEYSDAMRHIGVRLRAGRHLRLKHLETLDDLIHTVLRQSCHGYLRTEWNAAVVGERLQQRAHRQPRAHPGEILVR